MKTSIIEVHDMLAVLTVKEVEDRIGEVPGVESATANFAAGSVTVRYDETRLDVAGIKATVHQRGHQPADESVPAVDVPKGHEGHAMATIASSPAGAAPKAPTDALAAGSANATLADPGMIPPLDRTELAVPSLLTPENNTMAKPTAKKQSTPPAKKDAMAGMDHSKMPGMTMPPATTKRAPAKK